MHPKTVTSFFTELSKIASLEKTSLDATVLGRIADKAAKRGWSGARETKSIMRLAKREGQAIGKATGAHPSHSPTMFADTAIKAAPQNPTRVARPPAPAAGGTMPGVRPNSVQPPSNPSSNFRRNLAIGGGLAAAGGMVGYAMPHRQRQ